jgi:hypothetical protein
MKKKLNQLFYFCSKWNRNTLEKKIDSAVWYPCQWIGFSLCFYLTVFSVTIIRLTGNEELFDFCVLISIIISFVTMVALDIFYTKNKYYVEVILFYKENVMPKKLTLKLRAVLLAPLIIILIDFFRKHLVP